MNADTAEAPRARPVSSERRRLQAGLILIGGLLLFAVVVPLISPHDPYVSDFARGFGKDELPAAPGSVFWLGADRLYRDQLVRLALGARESLLIGLASTAIATVVGGVVGIVSGYFEGNPLRVPWVPAVLLASSALVVSFSRPIAAVLLVACALALWAYVRGMRWALGTFGFDLDGLLMWVVEVLLSMPFMILVMAVSATFERTSELTILGVLGLTGWLGTARIVRSKTMELRSREFVVASRALGQSTGRILLKHVLPNVKDTLLAMASLSVAQMILAESVLSYVGAGLSPPTPSWGHMLFEGQEVIGALPWLFFAPAVCILLAVLGFNLIGEGLRNAQNQRAS